MYYDVISAKWDMYKWILQSVLYIVSVVVGCKVHDKNIFVGWD